MLYVNQDTYIVSSLLSQSYDSEGTQALKDC
jgi:hypothetical protein